MSTIAQVQAAVSDLTGLDAQRIERPLSSLLSDITIAPSLAANILDTNVGEPWLEAIEQFEKRLITSRSRTRVKAARDLGEVAEGLRIVVRTPSPLNSSRVSKAHPSIAGCNKTTRFLPGPVPTHSHQCHNEHAGYTNFGSTQI